MLKFPFFGRKKLRLAFEYGLILANVAKENNVEVTPDLVAKAQAMLVGEAQTQTATHMAINIVPNILSAFELDLSK